MSGGDARTVIRAKAQLLTENVIKQLLEMGAPEAPALEQASQVLIKSEDEWVEHEHEIRVRLELVLTVTETERVVAVQ